MQTECTPALVEFEPVERRKVVAGFDGGIITSDLKAPLAKTTVEGASIVTFAPTRRLKFVMARVPAVSLGFRPADITFGGMRKSCKYSPASPP